MEMLQAEILSMVCPMDSDHVCVRWNGTDVTD